MGKGGGSQQPQSQTVTQTNLPEYARPYFENLLERTQAESYRDYTPYEGQRIAGFTPGQEAVQQEVAGMQTPDQFAPATGMTTAAGLGSLTAGQDYAQMATDPSQMQSYMSPYMQNVVDMQKQEAIRDAQKQQLGANLERLEGTYGGSRQLLGQLERERNLGSQLANIQAAGSQKAFEAAQQAQQFGANLGLRGLSQAGQMGAQLGQLGSAEQAANLQRLQAQAASAGEQRALEQQRMDMSYGDFLRQRDYPKRTTWLLQFYSAWSSCTDGIDTNRVCRATVYATAVRRSRTVCAWPV